ncbi:DUF4173 domain-containing protein [Candidatus Allofournierella excrementavium]|uniref:DUF4153 domain-containing protein n=1 Tax=Candidatus Allofournierella excrementavium TaxID=2838591 RepID=UPI00374F3F19
MEPRKKEGSACPPAFPAPKNQAMEPAAPAVTGEKTPPAYGPQTGSAPMPKPAASASFPAGAAAAPAPGSACGPQAASAQKETPAAPAPGTPPVSPAPCPGEAPATSRPPLPKWMVPAALVSWLWGWTYARGLLFGFEYRAVFMALFCLLFFAGVEGMCRAAARPASKESRLWLALWGLLAADYIFKISALYYYDAVQTWEFLALHLAAAYWVLARTGSLTEGRTGPFLPLDGLRALVTVPFGNFFLRIRVLLRALAGWLQGLAGRKKGSLWAGVVTLCVAAPVLALAAGLLSSADDAFGAALENFFRWFTLPEAVFTEMLYFAVGLPVGAYLFGLAAGALKKVPDSARGAFLRVEAEKLRLAPGGALALCLALLLALYVLFFSIQLNYLTGGFFGHLPEGFTAAEYARRGFFELCAVVVLNFSVLTAAAKTSRTPLRQSPVLKGLAAALCLSNLLFAAVGASKMFLYIRRFGFTPNRIVSGWFILVLAVLTVLALVSIFRPFPVVHAAAAVFCAMFLALCLSQPDVWLRAANRQLAAAGVVVREDVGDWLLYMPEKSSAWD